MNRSALVSLLFLACAAAAAQAKAQLTPGGPTGDFRGEIGPSRTPPGGSDWLSLPQNPKAFRDTIGGKPPDDILKGLDKSLGRSSLERPDPSGPSSDLGRDPRSPLDRLK